jgi:hypothetical protein
VLDPRVISSVALEKIAPNGLRGEDALLVSGLKQDKYGAIFSSSQARVLEVVCLVYSHR